MKNVEVTIKPVDFYSLVIWAFALDGNLPKSYLVKSFLNIWACVATPTRRIAMCLTLMEHPIIEFILNMRNISSNRLSGSSDFFLSLTSSETPPVKSTRAVLMKPPSMFSYDPYTLQSDTGKNAIRVIINYHPQVAYMSWKIPRWLELFQ